MQISWTGCPQICSLIERIMEGKVFLSPVVSPSWRGRSPSEERRAASPIFAKYYKYYTFWNEEKGEKQKSTCISDWGSSFCGGWVTSCTSWGWKEENKKNQSDWIQVKLDFPTVKIQGVLFNWSYPKNHKYGKKLKYRNWSYPQICNYSAALKVIDF